MPTKIIHYYHVFAAGPWQLILNQHMMAVCNYGLIDQIEEIRIGIVGPPEARKRVKETLQNSLIADKVRVVVERGMAWEQATLTELWKAAQTEDAIYFYAHTKGGYDRATVKQIWCRSMIFFNVVAFNVALEALQTNAAVGCHWLTKEEFPHIADQNNPEGTPYFAGNFWWSKSEHIRKLEQPKRENRFQAEAWIGTAPGDWTVKDLNPGYPDINKMMLTF